MSAPVDHSDKGVGAIPQSPVTPNWTIQVSDIKTVKVSNVSVATTEKDIKEFFSFSGDIQFVEIQRETESTKTAYVTFKSTQGADTAVLLTGSNIANSSVTITPVENYHLPPEAIPSSPQTPAAVKKAEEVVSTMLAKGFVLGKDALKRAKSFDERHHLLSNASATVASIDRKIGLSDKLSIGTAIVNEKVREMDEKFQVSEKTKSAIAVAEQKASDAGTAIMSNPYVSTGASWVSSAITAVAKAAEDVSTMTKEKVELAEVDKKEIIYSEKKSAADELSHIHSEKPSAAESSPKGPVISGEDSKLAII
ncbi:binding partner of ACD11 1 isoform X2 [Cicer arietinum]|uniref:Binding partner of ACD11 1 n=1 Tax=Cicer arietinum TaxID=3827 RepID=A0A1S2YDR8_CICAR|nr:binding partner of ACD11 1 [Cicer arietinum]